MKQFRALAVLIALAAGPALGQQQVIPGITLPPQTVIANTGIASGGAVAVPFASFKSALGLPLAQTCASNNWFNAISGAGVYTCAQPAITNIGGLAAGIATWMAAPTSANLAAAVTDETGSGPLVFGTAPTITNATMIAPNLGTPTAIALANGTGLPLSTGITGFGSGVISALGVNVGTAGSVVVNGGALGTPSAGVATNLTGTAAGLTAGNATLAATVTTNANLTGPVTSAGNATSIGANQVSRANLAQGVARSVVGVAGNATANVADIQGSTAFQTLGVNAAGTGLAFQSTRQIISLSMNTVPAAQASTFFTVMLGNATEASVQALCPIGGTFKNLFILSSAPASGQTLTATWRVNSADTALTCVVTGVGTTCSDTTHTATCTAGQPYSLKLVTSATTGSLASVSGGIEFDNP